MLGVEWNRFRKYFVVALLFSKLCCTCYRILAVRDLMQLSLIRLIQENYCKIVHLKEEHSDTLKVKFDTFVEVGVYEQW